MKPSGLLLAAVSFALSVSILATPTLAQSGGDDAQRAKQREKDKKEREAKKAKAAVKVGDPAPRIRVERWVKGKPVTSFEKGKVYVVEFWATWCPPCREWIPHLNQMQQDNPEVIFMAVASRERGEGATTLDLDPRLGGVQKFVADQGDNMSYRVGFERDRVMYNAWMEATGSTGIPHVFIVDHEGKLGFIGHPWEMEASFKKILKAAAKAEKEAAKKATDKTKAAETPGRSADKTPAKADPKPKDGDPNTVAPVVAPATDPAKAPAAPASKPETPAKPEDGGG
jgi:thiol-disulfide isomerase/thioredoxin